MPQRLSGIVKDRQALEATAFYDHLFTGSGGGVSGSRFEPVRD